MKQILLLLLTSFAFLVGCKKTDYPPSEEDYQTVRSINYYDLNAPSDVSKVETSDGYEVTVKKSVIENIGGEIDEGNILTLWENQIYSPVYIRIVSIVKSGDIYTIKGTKSDISEVFQDVDVKLNTQPYFNDAPSQLSRSVASKYQMNPSLVSSSGELHPSYIITPRDQILNNEDLSIYTENLVTDPKVTLPAESNEIVLNMEEYYNQPVYNQQNATGGIDFSIGVNLELKKEFKSGEGLASGSLVIDGKFAASLGYKFGLTTSWFKVTDFKSVFYGKYELKCDLKGVFQISKTIGDSDYVQEGTFSGYRTIFFVGPVPVEIVVEPIVERKVAMTLSGKLTYRVGAGLSGSFESGSVWSKDSGWSEVKSSEHSTDPPSFAPTVDELITLGMEIEAGIYLKGSARVYEVAGPYLRLGPKLTSKAVAKSAEDPDHPGQLGLGLDIDFHGKLVAAVGAELKFLKWSLAKVEFEFSLIDIKFYQTTKFFPFELTTVTPSPLLSNIEN